MDVNPVHQWARDALLVAGDFLIAVQDLMAKGKRVAAASYNPIGAYLAVAVVYLGLFFLLTIVLKWAERRAKIPGFEMETKSS